MRNAHSSIAVLTLTVACSSSSITSNFVDAGSDDAGALHSVGGNKTGTGGRSSTASSSLVVGGNGTAPGGSTTGATANTSTAGGALGVGGVSATGGATATGGIGTVATSSTHVGGAPTGGASGVATAAGGTMVIGGNSALGGASAATGGLAQGGSTDASGGTTGVLLTGGAPATGTPATGGAPSSGGTPSGGNPATGGAAAGGAATGGAATGGTTANPCGNSPCKNGGACSPSGSSFSCNCGTTGFTGTLCETNIDNCAGVTCTGHGSCVDGINAYTCNCNAGYSGTTACTAVPPTITQQPKAATVCLGTGATFTVAATGAGTITYAWYQSSGGVLYGPYGTGPSYNVSGIVGSGTPTPPFTLTYVAIATDSANGQTVQFNPAVYSVVNPPAFVIGNWGIDSLSTTVPHLWVQLNAPASGCLYYTYSNNGSSFYVQQLGICAGGDREWPNVGMPPDYVTPGNNIVQVTSVEGNSGLACETSSTWVWDGTTP